MGSLYEKAQYLLRLISQPIMEWMAERKYDDSFLIELLSKNRMYSIPSEVSEKCVFCALCKPVLVI